MQRNHTDLAKVGSSGSSIGGSTKRQHEDAFPDQVGMAGRLASTSLIAEKRTTLSTKVKYNSEEFMYDKIDAVGECAGLGEEAAASAAIAKQDRKHPPLRQ